MTHVNEILEFLVPSMQPSIINILTHKRIPTWILSVDSESKKRDNELIDRINFQEAERKTLNDRISTLNQEISRANSTNEELKTQLDNVQLQMTNLSDNLEQRNAEIYSQLNIVGERLAEILLFLPQFVRSASEHFIRLLCVAQPDAQIPALEFNFPAIGGSEEV